MRTIKFRIRDKLQKEFIPGDSINIAYDGSWCDFAYWKEGKYIKGELLLPDEGELNQFTGLLDSEGKEIYEFDILELKSSNYREEKLKVVMDCGQWLLENQKYHLRTCIYGNEKDITVIGNIYENPNLLD